VPKSCSLTAVVAGVGDVLQEQPDVAVVPADGGVGPFPTVAPEMGGVLLHVGGTPCPRPLVGEALEPLDCRQAVLDRSLAQISSQLLVAPPREHALEDLSLRMQQRCTTHDEQ
jgi:hypothetical protein